MKNIIYILLFISSFGYSQVAILDALRQQQYAQENQELYTVNNALSSISYEANSLTGLTGVGQTLSTETTDVNNGSYALRMVSVDGNSDRLQFDATLENGADYELKVMLKVESGAIWTLSSWIGVTDTSPSFTPSGQSPTSWEEKTITFTTSSTNVTMRFYNNGTAGTYILMDNLRLKKL